MTEIDKDMQNGCHNFLRVISALATFARAPDFENQALIVKSLVNGIIYFVIV